MDISVFALLHHIHIIRINIVIVVVLGPVEMWRSSVIYDDPPNTKGYQVRLPTYADIECATIQQVVCGGEVDKFSF